MMVLFKQASNTDRRKTGKISTRLNGNKFNDISNVGICNCFTVMTARIFLSLSHKTYLEPKSSFQTVN
jgi:hypothetical protein